MDTPNLSSPENKGEGAPGNVPGNNPDDGGLTIKPASAQTPPTPTPPVSSQLPSSSGSNIPLYKPTPAKNVEVPSAKPQTPDMPFVKPQESEESSVQPESAEVEEEKGGAMKTVVIVIVILAVLGGVGAALYYGGFLNGLFPQQNQQPTAGAAQYCDIDQYSTSAAAPLEQEGTSEQTSTSEVTGSTFICRSIPHDTLNASQCQLISDLYKNQSQYIFDEEGRTISDLQTWNNTCTAGGALTQQSQEGFQLTQTALTACPTGQVFNASTNRCACDINNNYFELNLPGAYTSPVAGQPSLACTTCGELSGEILKLGISTDPADQQRMATLQQVATANNCTACSSFDDQISKASNDKNWDEYFDAVVGKAQDKTCGRNLPQCDLKKWELLFIKQLLDKTSSDPTVDRIELEELRTKQQALTDKLVGESCVDMQQVCSDLSVLYGTTATTASTQAASPSGAIGFPALFGKAPATKVQTTQPTQQSTATQESTALSSTQETSPQNFSTVDLSQIKNTDLFGKDFYDSHCVNAASTQETGVRKVRRTKA